MLWLLRLLNPVKAVVDELAEWQKKKLDAKTEQQRIEADVRISALEAQRDLLVKEQDNFLTRSVRPAFAYPFILYLWKVVVWDKVIKGNWTDGLTDPLSEQLWWVFMLIVGAYFSFRGVEKIVRKVKG